MYQNNKLLSVDTALAKIEDKGTRVVVEDVNKNYYSFFKNKTDGSTTAAASSLIGFKPGDDITIIYEEIPYQGKTLRNVKKFRVPEANNKRPMRPVQASAKPTVSPAYNKEEMIGVLALMKVAGVSLEELENAETWQRFVNAYRRGQKVMAGTFTPLVTQAQETQPDISTQVDDINVEDIPF